MEKFKTGVLLAGGKSQRMGFDKQLLSVNNRRLVYELVHRLKEEFEEIIIVTNSPEHYEGGTGYSVISDEIKDMGPLGGIHTGLKAAAGEYVYFLACDMPCVNVDYIRFMKNKIKNLEVDACVTRFGEWIEPFNAFYSKSLIKGIEADLLIGKGYIFQYLKKQNCLYIEEKVAREFSPEWDMFLNLNTVSELDRYMRLLEGRA